MYQINETILLGKEQLNLMLNPDKDLTLKDMRGPILFTGYLNEEKISLKWESGEFNTITSYTLINIAVQYDSLTSKVLEKIQEHYRYLN